MTGAEIIEFFEGLVDDSIDEDVALVLMNSAKDKIEDERDWESLKATQTASATSSAIALPTDYRRSLAIYVGNTPYYQIPFEQKKLFENSANRWYLDFANSNYYLIGSSTGIVTHAYIKTTDELTTSTSPVWPSRFHKLLAFEMAELYYPLDQGERGRSWDDKWTVQKEAIRRSMIDWNTALTRRASENAVPPDYDVPIDIGLM